MGPRESAERSFALASASGSNSEDDLRGARSEDDAHLSPPLSPPLPLPLSLPLSLSQREIWMDQRAWPGSSHLNIGGGLFLVGQLDLACFKEALARLVAENDALRLAPLADGRQRILDHFEPVLEFVDLEAGAAPNPEAASDIKQDIKQIMRAWWQQRIAVPFVLDGAPPWRFALLRGSAEMHGLTIQFHHLVMDGWGTSQLLKRWGEIYNALLAGREPAPQQAPSYRQFIEQSLAYENSPAFATDAGFWHMRMPTLAPPIFDRHYANRRQQQLPAALLSSQRIPRDEYARMEQFAAALGVTVVSVFLAAIALYMSRIGNRREVVVGIPCLNRGGRHYKSTLGMFVGVIPLPVAVTESMTPMSLITNISVALRQALRHARYPMSELAKTLQCARHKRDSLFDVLLSFEREDYTLSFGDAELADSHQIFSGTARYALGVTVCEFQFRTEQDVELILEGSSDCFAGGELDLLRRRVWNLILAMMAAPDQVLEQVPLLPQEERWALIEGLHEDVARHDAPLPYISLFEHQAALNAEAVALVWDDGQMDYGTLRRQASRLADRLSDRIARHYPARNASADAIIAIAIPRSPHMVVAILAITMVGAAFLPLDLDAPAARLKGILMDSGALALVILDASRERLGQLHPCTILGDADNGANLAHVGARVTPAAGDLAYVLFTSGSTGKPKGAMIEHAALSRRLAWLSSTYAVDRRDRSAQATQLTFDPSLIELLLPLIHGASVALPPAGRILPESLGDFAVKHGVTIMAFVPSTLARFLDAAGRRPGLKLRVACCGGEVLAPELANRFLLETEARLYNVYGPTETALFASAWECQLHRNDKTLPIGRPVSDTRLYVLDQDRQLVPFGVAGEIYIGGDALGRGYVRRPDLDREAFLDDPHRPGQRMYRTGDRGFLRSDGNLFFLGRLDRQVKLRGYRIEPGEIETVLLSAPGVTQAAVKLVERKGKQTLHAWVASVDGQNSDNLQRLCRAHLPDYMVPGGITLLPILPTGDTGKIDFERLPEPGLSTSSTTARAPNSQLERNLLAMWEAVLDIRPLSVQDNFFELGGDSLAAIDILAGIERLLDREASLYLLTENPTVEQLATALEEERGTPPLMVRLSADSGRVPLYLAASGHGDLLRFQHLADALGNACELNMLQPPATHDIGSMAELATLYADHIEAQGDAPAYLAGFSVGGIVAMETCRILQQRGITVRRLFLIDTIYPSSALVGTTFWRTFWRILGWMIRNLHIQELSMNGRRLGAMLSDPGLVLQVRALRGYRPIGFDGPTLLIKSSGLANWSGWLFYSWRRLMPGNLSEQQVRGLHGSIFESGNVGELAETIASELDRASFD